MNLKRVNLHPNVQNLYKNISDVNFERLDSGINFPNFKSKFPEYFNDISCVHYESLKNRAKSTGIVEFENILNKIIQLL